MQWCFKMNVLLFFVVFDVVFGQFNLFPKIVPYLGPNIPQARSYIVIPPDTNNFQLRPQNTNFQFRPSMPQPVANFGTFRALKPIKTIENPIIIEEEIKLEKNQEILEEIAILEASIERIKAQLRVKQQRSINLGIPEKTDLHPKNNLTEEMQQVLENWQQIEEMVTESPNLGVLIDPLKLEELRLKLNLEHLDVNTLTILMKELIVPYLKKDMRVYIEEFLQKLEEKPFVIEADTKTQTPHQGLSGRSLDGLLDLDLDNLPTSEEDTTKIITVAKTVINLVKNGYLVANTDSCLNNVTEKLDLIWNGVQELLSRKNNFELQGRSMGPTTEKIEETTTTPTTTTTTTQPTTTTEAEIPTSPNPRSTYLDYVSKPVRKYILPFDAVEGPRYLEAVARKFDPTKLKKSTK